MSKGDRITIGNADVVGGSSAQDKRIAKPQAAGEAKKFLSVWFRCCHTYGRMYRNQAQTEYVGRCPKCGAEVSARIGHGGTNRRMFEAR